MAVYVVASGGGHTTYAIAIAERLKELLGTSRLKFLVPANDRLSIERLVSRLGRVSIATVVKPRNPLEGIDRFLARSPRAIYECLKVVDEPEVVVGSGSNFMLYPMAVSLIRGCRYLITVEAVDRVCTYSKANYLSSRLLTARAFLQWGIQKKNYPDGIVAGPVLPRPTYRPRDEGYVLVATGTVGHRRLIGLLIESGLSNVVAQVGDLDVKYVESRRPEWVVFNYDPDLERWVSRASVVITHQGVTAAEAAIGYGKPVIIAYNPDLPQTSTYVDAYYLSKLIGGEFLDVTNATASAIYKLIDTVRGQVAYRKYPDGALKIALTVNKVVSRGSALI